MPLDEVVFDTFDGGSVSLAELVAAGHQATIDRLFDAIAPLDGPRYESPDRAARWLTDEDLVRILKEPKNSLVRQYQTMFELEEVELEFNEDALSAVAREAMARNVGARGLRIILEELMLDLMYTIPSQSDISEVVITEDTVLNRSQPTPLKKAV